LSLLVRSQAQLLLHRQLVESRPLVRYPVVHDPPYRDTAHFQMLAGSRQAIALSRVRATGYPVDRYQIALSDYFVRDNAQIREGLLPAAGRRLVLLETHVLSDAVVLELRRVQLRRKLKVSFGQYLCEYTARGLLVAVLGLGAPTGDE